MSLSIIRRINYRDQIYQVYFSLPVAKSLSACSVLDCRLFFKKLLDSGERRRRLSFLSKFY
jgi:hypothetical protein